MVNDCWRLLFNNYFWPIYVYVVSICFIVIKILNPLNYYYLVHSVVTFEVVIVSDFIIIIMYHFYVILVLC